MDDATKHEIWIIAASTMVGVPLMAAFGFVGITGLIGI